MSNKRFQIEEMLSQDAHGAVFLALDGETGKEVLLQRFFPFGAGSGGLSGNELVSYNHALEQIKSIEHQALRKVLDGGCDPVDGIPFLIFQGREGVTLADFFSSGPITAEQGRVLAESALGLMIEIEKHFGESVDWLMMNAADVEVIDGGKGYRFSLDPMKWVGISKGQSFVQDLASLLETSLGWSGSAAVANSSSRLYRWLGLAKSANWSSTQALEALQSEHAAGDSGAEDRQSGQTLPPPSFSQIVLPPPTIRQNPAPGGSMMHQKKFAPRTPLVNQKKSNNASWMILGSALTGAAIIAVIVLVVMRPDVDKPANQLPPQLAEKNVASPVANPAPPVKTTARAKTKAADREVVAAPPIEPSLAIVAAEQEKPKVEEPKVEEPKPIIAPKRDGDYKAEEVALVREQLRQEVTVIGRVNRVRVSNSEKSLYIELGGDPEENVCGRYMVNLGKEGMSVSELGYLKGKTVKLKGLVQEEFGTKRVVINLVTRDQVIEQP